MNSPKALSLGLPGRVLLAVAVTALAAVGQPAAQWPASNGAAHSAQAAGDYSVYLPLVLNNPRQPSIFGIEMAAINEFQGLEKASDSGATFIRQAAVHWSEVEPTENGEYDWSGLGWLETGLVNASTRGMKVIVIVRSTPNWAQKYPGNACGPMAAQYFDDFGDFLYELVSRYSVPPYNALHWEIWNEPDIAIGGSISGDSLIGCWGEVSDPAGYGGGYYADMLEVVYPRIKDANPNAQVLVGGLLLDCDPAHGAQCSPSNFLQGILDHNGDLDGGNYFDGVSFHAYDYGGNLEENIGHYGNPNWDSRWDTTGPVLIAKARFLQGVLEDYDYGSKYLMNTESAVLCNYQDPAGLECESVYGETTKAYYVTQAYAAAIAEGLSANIWYTNLGWRGSALLETGSLDALPAYNTFHFAYTQLALATWFADFSGVSGVKGYKFDRPGGDVWVLWSLDGVTHFNVPLGGTPSAIYDSDGTSLAVTGSTTTVGIEPRYIVWPP